MIRAFVLGIWFMLAASCDADCDRQLVRTELEGSYVLVSVSDLWGEGMDATEGTMEVSEDEVVVDYVRADGTRYHVELDVVDKRVD